MELTLDETQADIRNLASDVVNRMASTERIEQVEATPERFDRELWAELARTGLLGVAVAEDHGGLGFGMVELAVVCEQIGRTVAPVPYVQSTVAGLALAATEWPARIAAGEAVIAVAAVQSTLDARLDGDTLSGHVVGVPWAHVADAVLLDVGDRLVLLDPAASGVTAQQGTTTGGQLALDLVLDRASVVPIGDGDAARRHRQRWLTALAATQAGVCAGALRIAADYTSKREQFGKPLSAFQGVALKAADGYVDASAIAAVARQAAWSIDHCDDEGVDPELAALAAAWWAAEGGQHCVHITQHVHGGMGADVTYPVHRFFLWGKQIELLTGGASALLAELGDALAAAPNAGDAVVL